MVTTDVVLVVHVERSHNWPYDHSISQPRGRQWGEINRPHGRDAGEGMGTVCHTVD